MRFSIIVAFYQGSDTDEELDRCMNSIKAQTFKDYEVILLHDGELLRPCKYDAITVERNGNQWGHNLRDYGMRIAKGDYFLVTNADNTYEYDALEVLNSMIEPDVKIYIMAAKLMGMNWSQEENSVYYDNPRDYSKFCILKGNPKFGTIDCMQLIAHRDIWKEVGYWYDLSKCSDGLIYQKICKTRPYKIITALIGCHY